MPPPTFHTGTVPHAAAPAPALQGVAIPAPTAGPAVPPFVAVWLQPKRNLPAWRAAGCNLAIGRDREGNSDGSDGVTLAAWQTSCVAAGLKYVVEPGPDLAADAKDPNRVGWLNPNDEPDGAIINAQDAKDKAAEEAVYVGLETFYARCKAASPTMPVVVNVDGNQVRYGRSDYARIFRACDRLTVDFYPVQRAEPVTADAAILDQIRAIPGGNKLWLSWIEVGWQHLNPIYFHGGRGPTVAEWRQEVLFATSRGLNVGWFPQSMGEDGTGFSTDAADPAIVAAMTAWAAPGGVDASHGNSPTPTPAPRRVVSVRPIVMYEVTYEDKATEIVPSK